MAVVLALIILMPWLIPDKSMTWGTFQKWIKEKLYPNNVGLSFQRDEAAHASVATEVADLMPWIQTSWIATETK